MSDNNTNNNNNNNNNNPNSNQNNNNNGFLTNGLSFGNIPAVVFPFEFTFNGLRPVTTNTSGDATTGAGTPNVATNNNTGDNTNINNGGFNFMNFGMNLNNPNGGTTTTDPRAAGGIPGITAAGLYNLFGGGAGGGAGGEGSLVEFLSSIGLFSNGRQSKHASENYMKNLKPLKLKDLKGDEICSICFENFTEYLSKEEKEELKSKDENMSVEEWRLKQKADLETKEREKLALQEKVRGDADKLLAGFDVDNDPAIEFPSDNTARESTEYHISAEGSQENTQDTETEKKDRDGEATEEDEEEGETDPDAHYAVELPQCKHHFGYSCIAEWLKSNVSCPLCRSEAEAEASDTRTSANSNTQAQETDAENSASGENNNNNSSNRPALIYYPVALTEIYIPIDWSGPLSTGINTDDPPISFPQESSDAMPSFGRRTGPPIPSDQTQTQDQGQGQGQGQESRSNSRPVTPGAQPQVIPRVIFRTTLSGRGAANSSSSLRNQRHHPYSRSSSSTNNSSSNMTVNENFSQAGSNNNSDSGSSTSASDGGANHSTNANNANNSNSSQSTPSSLDDRSDSMSNMSND